MLGAEKPPSGVANACRDCFANLIASLRYSVLCPDSFVGQVKNPGPRTWSAPMHSEPLSLRNHSTNQCRQASARGKRSFVNMLVLGLSMQLKCFSAIVWGPVAAGKPLIPEIRPTLRCSTCWGPCRALGVLILDCHSRRALRCHLLWKGGLDTGILAG